MRDSFFSDFKHKVDILSKEDVISDLFLSASEHPELTHQFYDLLSSIFVVDTKDYLASCGRQRGRRGGGSKGTQAAIFSSQEQERGAGDPQGPGVDYASVVSLAATERDVVLGYQRSEESPVEISPDRSQGTRLGQDSKLIILSQKHLGK